MVSYYYFNMYCYIIFWRCDLNFDLYFDIKQAVEKLEMKERQVYVLLQTGIIDAFKIGAKWMISKVSTQQFIDRRVK